MWFILFLLTGSYVFLYIYILYTVYMYTAIQKFGISKIFNVWSPLCSSRLYLIDQKYRKNSNIVKYYCNL